MLVLFVESFFSLGAKQATSNVIHGITTPITAVYNEGISQLPSVIFQPVIGLLSGFSALALGGRNMLNRNELENSKFKYKTGTSPTNSIGNIPNQSHHNNNMNNNNNNNYNSHQ